MSGFPNLNAAVFREYDIRGIAGRDLSVDFAYRLGQAFAEFAFQRTGKPVLTLSVGRDCRLTSASYAKALIAGLRRGGVHVLALGVCPTPLGYFSIHHYETDGAILVTGSHNPADYNGFKIALGKDALHGEEIEALKKIFVAGGFQDRVPGQTRTAEIIDFYIDYVKKSICAPAKPLRVVLDAGNGTASTVAPKLFRALGAEVIELFCELDGHFPNHHPDPTVPENLRAVVAAVREHGADFGIGYDGDADRIGVVDERGQVIYGDVLTMIFAREILKTHPGATIISEVKSSIQLYQDIAVRGGRALMWKTGHSLIKAKMKETGALLAGEMSGHIFFADRWFGFDDAIYASVRLYEILGNRSPLSSLTADLKPMVNTPEIRLDCEDAKKFALIAETTQILQNPRDGWAGECASPKAGTHSLDAKVTTLDGLRIDFENCWGLIRASNTQSVIVMRFEAQNEILLRQIQKRFEEALNEAARKLGHGEFNFEIHSD